MFPEIFSRPLSSLFIEYLLSNYNINIYGGQSTEFWFASQDTDEGLLQLTMWFSVEYPPEDPNSVIFGRKLTVDGRQTNESSVPP